MKLILNSFAFYAGLLLWFGPFSARAQNEGSENLTNAAMEAAAAIFSNALAQAAELMTTNSANSNEVTQAEAGTVDTNTVSETNVPAPVGNVQPGRSESRRQWMLGKRAGTPDTNEPAHPQGSKQTNAESYSIYRVVKPDYSAFKLVTERNIFDPNRVPHRPGAPAARPKITESFALVGVMSYDKGTFAFFDSSSSEYRKAVKVADTIAGYRVSNIEANSIKLAAGTNQVELHVGMQLRREEGGGWVPSAQSETYATASSPTTNSDSGSSGAENDVLERLRKRREQE